MSDGSAFLSPASVPGVDHPARDLAVPALHAELPGVEDLLAERGLDISYETVRRWVLKFERQQAEVRFARDSPLEERRFEPSVPLAVKTLLGHTFRTKNLAAGLAIAPSRAPDARAIFVT